jgi:rhodanese-related sulfurtransferase
MGKNRYRNGILALSLLVTSLAACAGEAEAVDPGAEPGGDITVETAVRLLESEGPVQLVDVRTEAEFAFVGHPTGAVNVPLLRFDPSTYGMTPNMDFVQEIQERFPADHTLLMICRSGGRSRRAAKMLLDAGYEKVYNVLEGVEGANDDDGHRTVDGWKVRGFPYDYTVDEAEVTPPKQ